MMLSDAEELAEDLERLEVRHIANPGAQFKFALLADFTDAGEPHTPQDEELLGAAIGGIEKLNERTAPIRFFCSIASANGAPQRESGLAGNASAASSKNSTIS
jgi:hypothetical protein